ncbi:septal ring lytic transglycosylase RlpA family protein [Aureimonas endophytica]|uniref:septal ring lytic transglycosylase RlpA family protein n=1 Tax=Aureimonas endophytica TaxID=2027858 RepID=UPI001FCE510F|nr:septal ring lytic transglycosylase RlpA family protein [Aureimonas endophytica]
MSTTSIPHSAFAQTTDIKTSCGGASWYSLRSRTASGEMMNPAAMTAAHKTLPLGSKVKVTNLKNNRSIIVTINDRGPFIKGRMIDLSKGAARELDFVHSGVARVQIEAPDGSGTKSCA